MNFSSGQSKLIALPPEQSDELGEGQGSFVEANSKEELLAQVDLDRNILERVLVRGDIFAGYRILGFIAAGGMGEIYVAERLDDDGARRRPVALKVLSNEHAGDAELMARLEREAELCQLIHSKHVVRIYEYGIADNGRGFMSMELFDGEELFSRMKHHKLFPLRRLAEIAMEALEGLHDIHSAGVVHRDIKPENIFLAQTPRGEVAKILDFGIARRVDDPDDPLLQQQGKLLATPQYMSPEQTRSPEVDHRSDIYSLGVVLYECAAGNPPFDGDTPYATMIAHQEQSVPRLPSTLDPEFCEFIYKALAKRPEERWQSARELRRVIGRWIDETSWVDDLPGEGGFSLSDGGGVDDDLFADLLGDSATPAPANETPMFGSTPVRPQTPIGVPSAGVILKKKKIKRRAASAAGAFNEEESLFEEAGAVPSSARRPAASPASTEAPRPAAPRQPAREPLLSSPLELEPTMRDRMSERQQPPAAQPVAAPRAAEREQQAEESSPTAKIVTGVAILLIIASIIGAALSMSGEDAPQPAADAGDSEAVDPMMTGPPE